MTAALLDQVLDQGPLGVAHLDRGLEVIAANASLGNLFRRETRDLIGTTLMQHMAPKDRDDAEAQLQALWKGSVARVESEFQLTAGDESELWLHWSATRVRTSQGAAEHVVAIFDETTAKHRAEAAAAAHLEGLERLDHLVRDFDSMISHEIRTALTGIQGISELIRDGDLEPHEVREYAGYIFADAERVNQLIADMLDLNAMETGRRTLRAIPVDVNLVVRQSVQRAERSIPDLDIRVDLDPDLPKVQGDPDRLSQVIGNLFDSLAKYSPGASEVRVTSSSQGNQVELTIGGHGGERAADFDDGLSGGYERYERSPSKVIGAGLGLAVARQIVELHGGRIWAEQLESGSVFRLALPVR